MTSRENLKKLSKSTLQKMCQDTGFDVKGKKKGDLVDLLFMSFIMINILVKAHTGLAQSCSHIGAVLLALNGKYRLKSDQDTACTSQLCEWVVPRSSNPIPQPVTQMDFGKPKAEGPTKVSSSSFDPRHPDDRGHDSIAHLWDIEDEVPEAVSEVIIDEDEGPSKEIERYIYSKGRVVPLTISTNLVKEIEMHSRGKRLSPLWHDLHKGRITSSSFRKVLRAGHSPNSLVRNIIEGSNLQK
ncbi:hypothetical protein FSP39_008877 [Pinctada imbricata]|uniref:Uncharacterized protein n=1 Tax=Pinctada imbricata TaxID=66713 RepID=A0AA89C8N2_PINIB|nr:hypothetical protein FSP39_008877 [Pinctada imbricata]